MRLSFLGAHADLQKAIISFVLSFCPSVHMQQLAANGLIFMKFYIWIFFRKFAKTI